MLTCVLIVASALSLTQPPVEAFRLTARAFGREVVIEVHGPPRAEAQSALSAALAEVRAIERLAALDGSEPGGLGQLNRAAGTGMVEIDPRLGDMLQRANRFCEWSEGSFGPLGGRLNDLWLAGTPASEDAGQVTALSAAIASSRCELLQLDDSLRRAELSNGVRADLFGFATGFSVDRAVEILGNYGISNGTVWLGSIARGFGPGVDGRGWQMPLSEVASEGNPEGAIWLRDRALAIAAHDDRRVADGDTPNSAYIHHRRGAPVEGVIAVLVSTELAADSQGLASSLFVTGSREGQMHLGGLKPAPAVRWLLGHGYGQSLMVDYHWTDITRGAP